MKKSIIALAALAASLSGAASTDKFDAPATLLISASQATNTAEARSGQARLIKGAVPADSRVAYIVTFADAADIALAADYEILSEVSNMAIIRLTADEAVALAKLPQVLSISLGYDNEPMLNNARVNTRVNDVHDGTGLDHGFTGKGVIVGMMDTGFEPGHINFRDSDGNMRINTMWSITGNGAVETITGVNLQRYTCDTSGETHATHVMGILAGSNNTRGERVALINERTGQLQISRAKNPYYGVATEAEIAPCIGTFQNSNIQLAAGQFLKYIKAQGKPGVINFSLGHNIGPHDGTTAANKYLSEMGKEMIICISAGNEGERPVSLHKDFKSGDAKVSTCVSTSGVSAGIFDVWGNDATAFKITFVAVKSTGEIVYSRELTPSTATVTIVGSGFSHPSYTPEPRFDDLFGARTVVAYSAKLNSTNNRYNAYVQVQTEKSTGDIYPGFIIEGQAGKSVDLYTNSALGMYSNNIPGFTAGNSLQSINDLACGDNVIVVGASINTKEVCTFGGIRNGSGEVGDIASFSSWGKTFGGRQLPDIVAPGQGMISSYNTLYYQRLDDKSKVNGSAEVKNGTALNYWMEMSGTSMSSPLVAGIMALWVEADPQLTVAKAKEVMSRTAVKDKFSAAKPDRFGMGKIDAYAGIKDILGNNSVAGIAVDNKVIVTRQGTNTFEIFAAGAPGIRADLYTLAGASAASATGTGETAILNAEGLNAGIYVLKVTAGNHTSTQKVVIR